MANDAYAGSTCCKVDLDQPHFRSDDGVVASLGASARMFMASGLDA